MKRWISIAGGLVVLLAAVLSGGGPRPAAVRAPQAVPSTSAIERGRDVYVQYGCAMCHGGDGKGGFPNHNAETDGKVPGVIYVAEGYTEQELRLKILDGAWTIGRADANGPQPPYRMPGWRGHITDRELSDLVAYLISLLPESAGDTWR